MYVEPQLARELPGSAVRVENGYSSIAIDGQCKYWIGGGWLEEQFARDEAWREGVLDKATQDALDAVLTVADLTPLADCGAQVISDDSVATIRATASSASCSKDWGPRFSAAWGVIRDRAAQLYSSGTPVAGALHVVAVEVGPFPGAAPEYAWPAGSDLASFLIGDSQAADNSVGVSKLAGSGLATALRTLRDQYIRDATMSPGLYPGFRVSDGARSAFLYMRDSSPYEDQHGILPFSGSK
ncbi:MAG: hypothetical protein ABIQ16_28075 [Polyangiaceae bacterium]